MSSSPRCPTCDALLVARVLPVYDASSIMGLSNLVLNNISALVCPNGDNTALVEGAALDEAERQLVEGLAGHRSLEGQELRFLRKHLELTQAQLAQWLGVDRVTITRWETGEQRVSLAAARAVQARALLALRGISGLAEAS